jgi:hypothetical protein
MSIDALVTGTLHKPAQTRTASNGNPFCTCTVRAPTRDPQVQVFVSVIAFDAAAVEALAALGPGDAVSLAGELTPKVYVPKDGGEPRPSLDLLAHAVLTPYAVERRRRAARGERQDEGHQGPPPEQSPLGPSEHRPGDRQRQDGQELDPFHDPLPL